MSWKNPPGSDDAVERGCVCSVFDNHKGRGWGGDGARYGWVVNEHCPIHAGEQDVNVERENTRAGEDDKA